MKSKFFVDRNFIVAPAKSCTSNNVVVYYIDDTWSKDFIDLNDFGSKSSKSWGVNLMEIDIFSKKGWTFPINTKRSNGNLSTTNHL